MNKLTYLNSTQDKNDTTVYLLPTNPRKTLYLQEAELYLYILSTDGDQKQVIPVNFGDDGVYFTMNQLRTVGTGTFAFYLEVRYADYSENYPDNTVKYITIRYDKDTEKVELVNIFDADYSDLTMVKPPKANIPTDTNVDTKEFDIQHVLTNTVDSGQKANVTYNPDSKTLIVNIPQGDPGDPGKNGKSAYQEWIDAGNEGSKEDFLASLKGPKGDKPVKGVDYLTDAEKQAFLDEAHKYVDDAIENGKW